MKKSKIKYNPEAVKKNRRFPIKNTVILVIVILLQIVLVSSGCLYQPSAQDRIDSYTVTVTPQSNGTLDIHYDIVWTALDENEPLTFVTIGMANPNYRVIKESLSGTIASYKKERNEDYVALRLDFKDTYQGGESVHFSFTVNQSDVLCKWNTVYFYEYVPCWFNRIPVSHYEFNWEYSSDITSVNTETIGTYCTWSGELDCGGYQIMKVEYTEDAFDAPHTVAYKPFEDDGAYNELKSDKNGVLVFTVFLALLGIIVELYVIDSYVSYHRGRGFMSGYGHHVHVYGRVNPHYRSAQAAHTSSGTGGGRGCACACACACAGGGRAGCSQKDTYGKFHDIT